jgi:hypothetical protein
MRGSDERGVAVLVCRHREPGAGEASAAHHQEDRRRRARLARFRVRPPLRGDWAPVDRAGAPASRLAVASVLLGALRAAVDGANRLQSAVPLVRGAGIDDAVWDHSTFSKNRDRLLDADVAAKFLAAVLRHPRVKRFLSDDHFSVDGTLVEAWASLKNFRAKDGSDEPPSPGRNGERDFHGEKRANDTHESKTDPDAKLFRKGKAQPAKLYFMGHALIENRHGLVVQADATAATGKAERQAALAMIDRHDPRSA